MKHLHFLKFIEDLGDCLGGFMIGIAYCKHDILLSVIGAVFIAFSLLLKHYKPK